MSRHRLPVDRRRRHHVNCYLEKPLVDAVDAVCVFTHDTRSGVLRKALIRFLSANSEQGA
jgi:hypothetical protein